jgi:hypothetical protein
MGVEQKGQLTIRTAFTMKERITKLFGRLRKKGQADVVPEGVDFNKLVIPFVPKGSPDSAADASKFGAPVDQYQFWRPHMCAVCCLKMVGDAAHKTNTMSLSTLVDECVAEGVFTVSTEKEVRGAFHFPLAHVMEKLGMPARVAGKMSIEDIICEIRNGKVIFLSVDLSKLEENPHPESHLVVVYGVDDTEAELYLHDCASVLSPNGNGIHMAREELAKLSNGKGLVIG